MEKQTKKPVKRIDLTPIIELLEQAVSDAIATGIEPEDRKEVESAIRVYARRYPVKADVWEGLQERLDTARTIFPGQLDWEARVLAVANKR